ncbi:hypothetical protein WJX75_004977 [Coccomyxa subellipsoidea]|uniref:Protein kinase domain-containing protein n=1 Tax=Coccomyxa subellipsoidea TaxID=248742 RepID=A0ABR2YD10_9CHLO
MQLSRRCRGNVATAALLCFYFLHTCLAQPGGLPKPPTLAPSPTPLLLVSPDDWTGLTEPGTGRPVTRYELYVAPGVTEIELQLTGKEAIATDDNVDLIRSTLAEVLPVTYGAINPVAVKNVTSCPELPEAGSPAAAPAPPAQRGSGRRLLLDSFQVPGRALQGRSLQQSQAFAPPPVPSCDPKMRAVYMLTFPPDINGTHGQALVRDAVQTGLFSARLKRRKLDIERVELLASIRGDSPETAYTAVIEPTGAGMDEGMLKSGTVNLAPAPSFDAAAQQAIASANPANATAVNVYFTLVLTGYDAVDTNGNFLLALTKSLTDTLNTGAIDYLTPENTAVTDVASLKPVALPGVGSGRRRLLTAAIDHEAGNAPYQAYQAGTAEAAAGGLRRGHPKIVGGSRGGSLGAVDGRPRKGQESVGEGPEGFNAIGQPQKGRMHAGAAGGVHRGFKDDGSRGGVEAAGELISGRPAKDVEADRTVTRLGLVRIRAPDVSQSNAGEETGVSGKLLAGAPGAASLEEQHQHWGSRLAFRAGELCNLREGARVAGTHCLRRRSLLQELPAPPASEGPSAPDTAPAPAPDNMTSDFALANYGPVPSLAVSYQVWAVPLPGPAVIADKLSYFIRTGQMVGLFQAQGFRINYVQLAKYSPLPGVPAAAPEAAASTADAGLVGGMKIAKLLAIIIIPVAFAAIVTASVFAYLFFRNKRRFASQAGSERPVKDSAQSMHSARSSGGKSDMRTSGSGSTTVRSMLDTLYSSKGISGQEALALASLSKKSLTLPGMQSDWEIDPDELEICRRPDGTEWELGSGASARVYKAIRTGVQTVAVKIFTDQVTAEHQMRYAEAFRREIFILRSCHDRNIVQFIGACLQEGQTILVQEYMENGDLFHAIAEDSAAQRFGWYRQRLPTGRLAPATGMARRIALDIARGLFFLHSRKVVHFDLKSANILLARDWTAKIADVGLAKILKDGWLSTLREVGTFSWAAPEVLLGRPCTEKVDIYSYGVMLWELSAGEAPPGRHLRPLRVPEECPADVEAMIARCLDNDPDARPSARELVDFMVELPHALSREEGSSNTASTEPSCSGTLGEPEQLGPGRSLTPMTPKRPPAGMVMPNAFGLLSMQSFRRNNSGLGRSNSGLGRSNSGLSRSNSGAARAQSGEVPAAGQDAQATTAPGGQATIAAEEKPPRPQKRAITIPSAFKYLTSTSFKREPPPPPPGVPSIPDAPEEELEAAVMQSNKSLSAAAAKAAEAAVKQALQQQEEQAAPSKGRPPVIRSAFEQEPGP